MIEVYLTHEKFPDDAMGRLSLQSVPRPGESVYLDTGTTRGTSWEGSESLRVVDVKHGISLPMGPGGCTPHVIELVVGDRE